MISYYQLQYVGIFHVLQVPGGLEKAATMKMGPNDARHVVWAFGKFFFFFDLLLISTLFSHYICSEGMRWVREGGDD